MEISSVQGLLAKLQFVNSAMVYGFALNLRNVFTLEFVHRAVNFFMKIR